MKPERIAEILQEHFAGESGIQTLNPEIGAWEDDPACVTCDEFWPCETYQLATLATEATRLREALVYGRDHLGGWREVVCEIEDLGPPEHVAKAMYAVVDQMDAFKGKANEALARAGPRPYGS